MLAGASAAAAWTALPECAHALAENPREAAARALLDAIAEELLAEYPESAASFGIDKDQRVRLKARLTDRSPAGNTARATSAVRRLKQIRDFGRAGLSHDISLDLEVAEAAHELAVDGYRGFFYGDVAVLNASWNYRNAPYSVSQNVGAYIEIPDLLDTFHTVASAADAEAYLLRLDALAATIDGESERAREEGVRGIIPPDFAIDTALGQMKGMLAQPASQWSMATSFARKVAEAKLAGDYPANAERIIAARIMPALARQQAVLQSVRARADDRAGVWKLRDGDAYYAWALRAATTSAMSPDEVHAMGLEQVRMLGERMDALLRAQGLTQGSVGQRLEALGKRPDQVYSNDDAGRAQILAYLNDRIADIRTRLPRAFDTLVKGNLVIKRVPPAIEAGAPNGYAGAGSLDGSIPGNYYINLKDTSIWPRFTLPTLTYHEGIPGHVWQGEYTFKLPLARALLAFNAYSEGWALYAEQLADELGAYDQDPAGRLGYLQSLSFRACRLVVDTGLHAKRWTREQAIRWFAETNGSTEQEVRGEVDRYCTWPGQACGYKVGHSEIVRLRDKAKAALGPRFELAAFDDAVVLGGSVPLTLLERVIDRYIAAARV